MKNAVGSRADPDRVCRRPSGRHDSCRGSVDRRRGPRAQAQRSGGASACQRAGAPERSCRSRSTPGSRARSPAPGSPGRIESTLEKRLGRPVDPELATLGRDLFFDKILGLHGDNACAGCHSPTNGFGDTQSIAIGIQNNNLVGPGRTGPRNQRRTPMVINNAFFPKLMWNGRFRSPSGDPFDNSQGFVFPPPESTTKFLPSDEEIRQLLVAQAHIPPTEQTEVAGLHGRGRSVRRRPRHAGPAAGRERLPQRADPPGGPREGQRRARVPRRVRAQVPRRGPGRAGRLQDVRPGDRGVRVLADLRGRPDRPLRARRPGGDDATRRSAGRSSSSAAPAASGATPSRVRRTRCSATSRCTRRACRRSRRSSAPGRATSRSPAPAADEDFGLEDITADAADRYKFRTSPLRNLALQPAFFHDGAFTRLEDAVRYHLDAAGAIGTYDPARRRTRAGPVRARRAARRRCSRGSTRCCASRSSLSDEQVADLVAFLREGLLDDRARPENLRALIPASVPSGLPMLEFE